MCIIELVDYNEFLVKEDKPSKAKRSRRGKAKKSTQVDEEAKSDSKGADAVQEKNEEEVKEVKNTSVGGDTKSSDADSEKNDEKQ